MYAILGFKAFQDTGLITMNHEHFVTRNEVHEEVVSEIVDIMDIKKDISSKFNQYLMVNSTLTFDVDPNVEPVKMTARKVPLAIKGKLNEECNQLEKLDVIRPVDRPTDWIPSLVVAPKANGRIRLCIDPRPLNQTFKRNRFPTPVIEDILPELSKARLFCVVDARDEFWHVALDEPSSYLTTFATPWGRNRWMRMPFGISPAPEEFHRRMQEAWESIDGIKPIHTDDILSYGSGETDKEAEEDHDRKIHALLQRCVEKNIKLNKDKLKLKVDSVAYLGFVISKEGLRIDPTKVKTFTELPTP